MSRVSSTSGLHQGNLLHEISRLRTLLDRSRRRQRATQHSRDYWRERAQAAEWGLKQHQRKAA